MDYQRLPQTEIARRVGHKISRWTYIPKKGASGYKYYSRCEVESCGKEITLTKARQNGNWKCKTCSRSLGVVKGVSVWSPTVWAARKKIVSMRKEGRANVPYVHCRVHGCENEVRLNNSRFRQGKKLGACLRHAKISLRLRPFEAAYNSFCKKIPRRGHINTLTYNQFALLCSQTSCHYCTAPLRRSPYSGKGNYANFIDRKDPRKGYIKGNCVACCTPCNFTKNCTMTHDEMLIIGCLRAGNKKRVEELLRRYDCVRNEQKSFEFYSFTWKKLSDGRTVVGRKNQLKP